jgi:branched-chain amino acid transport system ATP-binding protein
MSILLKVDKIRVHYGYSEVVKGVSLHADGGAIVTLIGNNGAGKSTILKTISGVKAPTAGEIWFRDIRIDGLAPATIVAMGLSQVPEGRKLFPNMSVMENLLMGAYLRKEKAEIKKDIDNFFNYFPPLKDRSRQMASTLSGGEQQMLTIGRALMSRPTLLLLDEPSLGLAPLVIKKIAIIIKAINERGTTILLVEQNARLALGLAHSGYILETGQIVLEGPAKDIATNEYLISAYLGAGRDPTTKNVQS